MAKDIDWGNLPFGYMETSKSFVANWKDGAWDEGTLTSDHTITMSECACVLQYAQTCFEGLKAYTTSDGKVVTFRPDLNADRMADSCTRLEMPVFPKEKFIQAVIDVVKANLDYVPPYGSGATLYIRPFMFGSNAVIGVKPATEFQFRILVTPVGPYFKGGVKPIKVRISDRDRAAPHGTGDIKAGLNYAMSLYNIVDAHNCGYAENTRQSESVLGKDKDVRRGTGSGNVWEQIDLQFRLVQQGHRGDTSQTELPGPDRSEAFGAECRKGEQQGLGTGHGLA